MKTLWLRLFAFTLAVPVGAGAEMVTLLPSKDNTLFEDGAGSTSNGVGQYLFVGRTLNPDSRRGLLAFDLTTVPAGSSVESATLTLHMSRTIAGAVAIGVHRATQDWGEGLSNAAGQEGGGAPAQSSDATWLHNFFNTSAWTAPGGDFEAIASAVTDVGRNTGFYVWTSPRLLQDVQGWVDGASTNFGWLLLGDESTTPTAKRFDSRENPNPAFRPTLTITYSAVPEPATGLMLTLFFVAIRLRRRSRHCR